MTALELSAVHAPQGIEFLRGLQPQEVDLILAAGKLRRFSAKCVITHQGEPAGRLLLMWKGRARNPTSVERFQAALNSMSPTKSWPNLQILLRTRRVGWLAMEENWRVANSAARSFCAHQKDSSFVYLDDSPGVAKRAAASA